MRAQCTGPARYGGPQCSDAILGPTRQRARTETMETLSQPSSIRVLLVDDHKLLTDALSGLLRREPGIEVVGVAGSVKEARLAASERMDVVLMDYMLPDGTGAEATREIKRRWPSAKVIVLTAVADDETMLDAIESGADGYLTKEKAGSDVVAAVRAAYTGEMLLPRGVAYELAQRVPSTRVRSRSHIDVHDLTPRELEVLKALVEGQSSRDI